MRDPDFAKILLSEFDRHTWPFKVKGVVVQTYQESSAVSIVSVRSESLNFQVNVPVDSAVVARGLNELELAYKLGEILGLYFRDQFTLGVE